MCTHSLLPPPPAACAGCGCGCSGYHSAAASAPSLLLFAALDSALEKAIL